MATALQLLKETTLHFGLVETLNRGREGGRDGRREERREEGKEGGREGGP